MQFLVASTNSWTVQRRYTGNEDGKSPSITCWPALPESAASCPPLTSQWENRHGRTLGRGPTELNRYLSLPTTNLTPVTRTFSRPKCWLCKNMLLDPGNRLPNGFWPGLLCRCSNLKWKRRNGVFSQQLSRYNDTLEGTFNSWDCETRSKQKLPMNGRNCWIRLRWVLGRLPVGVAACCKFKGEWPKTLK